MPVFSLRDLVAEDLKVFNKLSPQFCTELCTVGLTFLSQGAKKGTFKKAAIALSIDEDAVAGAVIDNFLIPPAAIDADNFGSQID